jgi:Zn-dependent protease
VLAQLLAPGLSGAGIAVSIGLLIFSLGVHEAAHGQVALWCGDPTARDLGRITLDPRAHIDPFNTIILPVVLYMTAGFMFGGAKPVPVNMRRLRHPLRDMSFVALAGPASNFILAVIFSVAYLLVLEHQLYTPDQMMVAILRSAIIFNLLLAAFNLMPIPPLDGSRVMTWLLPDAARRVYMELERYGMLIVIGVVFFVPGFQGVLLWAMRTLQDGVFAVANPIVDGIDFLIGLFT